MTTTTTTITDGAINYDASGAKSAVDAIITERFKLSADIVVAVMLRLAEMKHIDPEVKITAASILADHAQEVITAVYAGRVPPVRVSGKPKPHVTHTVTAEPTVDPAIQALAEMLYGGDVDRMISELTEAFEPIAEFMPELLEALRSTADESEEQRKARLRVATNYLAGKRGWEVDDDGQTEIAKAITDLREQLRQAKRDLAAANGRVETADQRVKDADKAKNEALEAQRRAEAAQRTLEQQLTTAKEGQRAALRLKEAAETAQREAEEALESVRGDVQAANERAGNADRDRREAQDALRRLQARVAGFQDVFRELDAVDSDDVLNARMRDIRAAALGALTWDMRQALRDVANNVVGHGGPRANGVRSWLRSAPVTVLDEVLRPVPDPQPTPAPGSGS